MHESNKIFIIAEIGINHNGDIDIAKELIDVATAAGCDAVKFQKRDINKVYPRELLDSPRESPWGTTQREQKQGLEFSWEDYQVIDSYCKKKGIEWFASAWDLNSIDFFSGVFTLSLVLGFLDILAFCNLGSSENKALNSTLSPLFNDS